MRAWTVSQVKKHASASFHPLNLSKKIMKCDVDLILNAIAEAALQTNTGRHPDRSSIVFYNPYLYLIDLLDSKFAGKFDPNNLPIPERVYCHLGVDDFASATRRLSWNFITDLTIGWDECEPSADLQKALRKDIDFSHIRSLNLSRLGAGDDLLDTLLKFNSFENLEEFSLPRISDDAFRRFASSGLLMSLRGLSLVWEDLNAQLIEHDCPQLIRLTSRASSNLIQCIEQTSQFPSLSHLRLLKQLESDAAASQSTPYQEFAKSNKLISSLQVLELNEVKDEEFDFLVDSQFPNLTKLNLAYSHLTGLSNVKHFTPNRFPGLKQLDLSNISLGDEGLIQLTKWDQLFKLENLNLSSTNISSTGLNKLAESAKTQQLNWRSLDLSGNFRTRGQSIEREIDSSAIDALVQLPTWRNCLTSLKLSGCDLSNCNFRSWDRSIQDNLEILEASFGNLNDRGMNELFNHCSFPKLKTFIADHNHQITPAGVSAVFSSKNTVQLRQLDLSSCDLEDRSIDPILSASSLFESLRILSVDFNKISSEGLSALIQSGCLKNIWELSISGNDLGDSFDSLNFDEFFDQLIVVNIRYHQMSSDVAKSIKSKLEQLNLQKVAMFPTALPQKTNKFDS